MILKKETLFSMNWADYIKIATMFFEIFSKYWLIYLNNISLINIPRYYVYYNFYSFMYRPSEQISGDVGEKYDDEIPVKFNCQKMKWNK